MSDESANALMTLTVAQTNLIIALFVLSGTLSLMGSSLIVYKILTRSSSRNSTSALSNNTRSYHRLILGLSLMDIFASFRSVFFSIFFYPINEPSPVCTADGFFHLLAYGSAYYNMALSFYYTFVLVINVPESKLRKWYEPILLFTPAVVAISSSLAGIGLNAYNPGNLGCPPGTWPTNCKDSWSGDKSVECERGQYSGVFIVVASVFPLSAVFISLVVNNVLLVGKMVRLERKSNRYVIRRRPSQSQWVNESPSRMIGNAVQGTQHRDNYTQSRKVAAQGFLYVASFFASYCFQCVILILVAVDRQGFNNGKYFGIFATNALFYPMQGLFNFLVYIRPTYLQWRDHRHTTLSRWKCFYNAAFTREAPYGVNVVASVNIAANGDHSSFLRNLPSSLVTDQSRVSTNMQMQDKMHTDHEGTGSGASAVTKEPLPTGGNQINRYDATWVAQAGIGNKSSASNDEEQRDVLDHLDGESGGIMKLEG